MPRYSYKAVDARGKVATGVSTAESLEALTRVLGQQGLFLMEGREDKSPAPAAAPVPSARPLPNSAKLAKAVKVEELAAFTQQFSMSIKGALPLLETVQTLAQQQTNPTLQAVLYAVSDDIQHGQPISQAMARFPTVFDGVYCSMVSVGEATGKLVDVLQRLVNYLEFQRQLRSRLRSALLYPAVVIITALAVCVFLIMFVIPTFAEIFAQFNIELPLPTKVLLAVSRNACDYWFFYFLAIFLTFNFGKGWLTDRRNRHIVDPLILRIPVVGVLARNVALTRILRTLSALVTAGTPILKALELTRAVAGNAVFEELIDDVARNVSQGKGISPALARHPHFPRIVANMIGNSEKTGQVAEVLENAANFYDAMTENSIKDLFSVIEPVFIVVLGAMVSGIALCVLLPMFNLGQGLE